MAMSNARASAMRPLIIPVLFTTCVAMVAGNAAVLIFNLEPLRTGDSNVDHVRRGSHIELLKSSPVEAATAESEYSPAGMPTGTIPTLVRESRYGDISAAPILLISRGGIPAYDGLLLRARDQASLTQLQRTILAYDRERPYSIMPAARAYRSSDRNSEDAAVTAQLRESDKPAPYSRVRSTALAEMVVNVAAIAVLVLFYLVIRRSFARQLSVHETLKSHNRDLERVVAQRTRELSELSGHLIRVAEEEKARLARDLHDELGASLTAMKFDVAYVAAKLKDSAPPLAERLQRAIDTLRHTFHLKQRLVQDLWPTMLEHVGLSAALLAHSNEFAFRTYHRQPAH